MKLRLKAVTLSMTAAILVTLLGIAPVNAQSAPKGDCETEHKPLMAEQVFKNVLVLHGITVAEFMGTMGFIAASLSLNCLDCHVDESADDFAKYAVDTPIKQTARKMLLMVQAINKQTFGGVTTVTCYTCHRSDVAGFSPPCAPLSFS